MATAFGPEGCVILHMLAEIEPRVRVFNLDTGYQFAETLELRDQIAERYGIEVELVRPDTTVAEYEAKHGGPLYGANPTSAATIARSCRCARAVVGYEAWISAIRADQSAHRAKATVVGWDHKFGLVKINPLLRWTQRDVWAFIVANRSRTTRCTIRDIPRSVAGRARGPSMLARTSGPAAGPARPRPSAACTRSTAASSERATKTSSRATIVMKISAKSEYACLAVLALARKRPERSAGADPRDFRSARHPRALPGPDPVAVEGGRAGGEHPGGGRRLPPGPVRGDDLGRRDALRDRRPEVADREAQAATRPAAAVLDPLSGRASAPPSAPSSTGRPSPSSPSDPPRATGSSEPCPAATPDDSPRMAAS